MKKAITPNIVKACNLLGLLALLYLIDNVITWGRYSLILLPLQLLEVVIVLLSAYLIRVGYQWVKWLWVITVIAATYMVIGSINNMFKYNVAHALISSLIIVVQIMAVIFMFLPAKKSTLIIQESAVD